MLEAEFTEVLSDAIRATDLAIVKGEVYDWQSPSRCLGGFWETYVAGGSSLVANAKMYWKLSDAAKNIHFGRNDIDNIDEVNDVPIVKYTDWPTVRAQLIEEYKLDLV